MSYLHAALVMLQRPLALPQVLLSAQVVVVPLQYLRPVQSAADEHCLPVWRLQLP